MHSDSAPILRTIIHSALCRVFYFAFNKSGMNYQQRKRALFECIRQRCAKTANNHDANKWHDGNFIYGALFRFERCFYVTLPYA